MVMVSMSLMVHINCLSCTNKSLSLLDGGNAKSLGLSFLTGVINARNTNSDSCTFRALQIGCNSLTLKLFNYVSFFDYLMLLIFLPSFHLFYLFTQVEKFYLGPHSAIRILFVYLID